MTYTTENPDQDLPAPVVAALENATVAELLNRVRTRTSISYAVSDGTTWASATQLDQTTIWHVPSKRPAEAMAHELLHAEPKLDGYRQYLNSVAKAPCEQPRLVSKLLRILDNELQHHKMAPRFQQLGFDITFFYEDGDKHAFKKVRRALEKMGPNNATTAEFFTQFVTMIAQGGAAGEIERTQIKNYFNIRAGKKIAERMSQIEGIFTEWRNTQSLDAGPFIQAILELMALKCSYWFGASTGFPGDGFFVGESFEVNEAQQI